MPLKIHVTISPSLPAKVQKKLHEDNSPVQIFLFLIVGFSFFYTPLPKPIVDNDCPAALLEG